MIFSLVETRSIANFSKVVTIIYIAEPDGCFSKVVVYLSLGLHLLLTHAGNDGEVHPIVS